MTNVGARTIYVRADDLELWDRAAALAKRRRLTMSALIMTALEAYLAAEESAARREGESRTDTDET